jgi:hypothetical protein
VPARASQVQPNPLSIRGRTPIRTPARRLHSNHRPHTTPTQGRSLRQGPARKSPGPGPASARARTSTTALGRIFGPPGPAGPSDELTALRPAAAGRVEPAPREGVPRTPRRRWLPSTKLPPRRAGPEPLGQCAGAPRLLRVRGQVQEMTRRSADAPAVWGLAPRAGHDPRVVPGRPVAHFSWELFPRVSVFGGRETATPLTFPGQRGRVYSVKRSGEHMRHLMGIFVGHLLIHTCSLP